ncbi:MAG: hypothetical protein O7E57_04505 [Gammaproteobacteria bacterium]|nr:hypothetical protein [Gammaproteobacteria bacterium]
MSTEVAFTIRLTVTVSLVPQRNANSFPLALARLWFSHLGSKAEKLYFSAGEYPLSLTQSLELDVVVTSGSPFRVMYRAWAFGGYDSGSSSNISGTIDFVGLPPGVAVTSCNGFGQSVPVSTATWGRIKALYQ